MIFNARVSGLVVWCVVLGLWCIALPQAKAKTPREVAVVDFSISTPKLSPSRSCTSCHVVDSALSHPVNMRPTMAVNSTLPLDDGLITCTTCHLDDSEQHTIIGTNSTRGAMLRGKLRGAAFCTNCHDHAWDRGASHADRYSRAHLAWSGRSDRPASAASVGGVLDEVSRQCMDCHDGSRGKDIGTSHPVGMIYGQTPAFDRRERAASSTRRLVVVGQLDPRIKLVNGAVSCVSCHDPYSQRSNMLVMANVNGSLCTSCHDLR